MKPKNLIPLIVVVAILLALVVYKNNSRPQPTLTEQAGPGGDVGRTVCRRAT